MISNGDATHKNALISSTVTTSQHSALYVNLGAATINNFGTIKSASASAIHLNNGGTITNGSTADITALHTGEHVGIERRSFRRDRRRSTISAPSAMVRAGRPAINLEQAAA